MIERDGGLFAADEVALAHGCNVAEAMGAGIAVGFKSRWPEMYAAYKKACASREFQVGGVFEWHADDRMIFNPNSARRPTRPTWFT